MNLHTVSARAAAALVATIAGAASWEHIASVAYGAGGRAWVAYSLPAAIDGLIVVGVAALLEDRKAGRLPRRSARVAVAVGVLATLAANIASAEPTWTARLVAVAAPISFLISIEVLTRAGRKIIEPEPRKRPARRRSKPGRQPGRTPATRIATQRADLTPEDLARLTGVTPRHARRVLNDRKVPELVEA